MVSVADLVGLVVVIGVNAAVAALGTRILRVRLATRWGVAIYVLVLVPVVQVLMVLVLTGPLGLGPNLGGAVTVLGVAVALPFALGVAFDYFWMPAPAEVELPETLEES
jgi:predicted PurR-regulated permease PerM